MFKNVNVMSWNYRSYGRSTGEPNPYNTFHDAETVLKFLIEEIGIKGKIGCFGRSIGGTIATHLAKNYPEYIDFLFIDRSLGSLDVMSESTFLGNYSKKILSYFSQNWVLESDRNFLEAKCFKMLSQDPKDTIVNQYCALNAQVARVACDNLIGENRFNTARHPLKIEKSLSALRLLFLIEAKLNLLIRKQGKTKRAQTKKKNKAP